MPEALTLPRTDSARVQRSTIKAVRTLLQCLDSTHPLSHNDRAFIQEIFQRLMGLQSADDVRRWIEEYERTHSQQNSTSATPGRVIQESQNPRATFPAIPQNAQPGFERPPSEPMAPPNPRPRRQAYLRKRTSNPEKTETSVSTMSSSASMTRKARCTIEEPNSTSLIMKNIPFLPPRTRVVYGPNAVEVRDRVRGAIALLGGEVDRIEKIADETVKTAVPWEEALQYCKRILDGVNRETAKAKCNGVQCTPKDRKDAGKEMLDKFYDWLKQKAPQDQNQTNSPHLAHASKSTLGLRKFQDIEEEGDEAARVDHSEKRQRFRNRDDSLAEDDIDLTFLQDVEMREPNADELQMPRNHGSRSPTWNPVGLPGVERRQPDVEPTEEIIVAPTRASVQGSGAGPHKPASSEINEDSELLEQLISTKLPAFYKRLSL